MAESKIVSTLKQKIVTGTTNNLGSLGIDNQSECHAISADTPSGATSYLVMPFASGGYQYVKVVKWTDMTPIANTQVTVRIWYI